MPRSTCYVCREVFKKPQSYMAHACFGADKPPLPPQGTAGELVGRKVLCLWEEEKKWFPGELTSFKAATADSPPTYKVTYDDGDYEDVSGLPDKTVFVVDADSGAGRKRANPEKENDAANTPRGDSGGSGGAHGGEAKRPRGRPPAARGRPATKRAAGGSVKEKACSKEKRVAAPREKKAEPAATPFKSFKGRGVGFERGGQCVIKIDGQWVRTEVGNKIKEQTTCLADNRWMKEEECTDGTWESLWVPGWLGVHTCPADGHNTKWTADYAGPYSAHVWDRSRAVWQWVGRFPDLEAAARHHDAVNLAYVGHQMANTNFPLPNTPAPEAEPGTKDLPMQASRILLLRNKLEGTLKGSTREWEEWYCAVNKLQISPGTLEGIKEMARRLKWMLQMMDEDVLFADWRGKKWRTVIEACDHCDSMGNKTHHAEVEDDCFQCTRRTGSKLTSTYKHSSTSLYALCAVLLDAVCEDAVVELVKGGDEVGVVERASHMREEIIKHWKAKTAGEAVPAKIAYEPLARRKLQPKEIPAGLEVIVIGAGAAGLKAAADLENMGARVTVVEARDRIGGRVHTYQLGEKEDKKKAQPVDLGATFVCGTALEPPVNPLFILIRELGIQLAAKHRNGPDSTAWFDANYKHIDDFKRTNAVDKYALVVLDRLLDKVDDVGVEVSIQEAVDELLKQDAADGIAVDPRDEEILNAIFADLYNTTMDKLSLRGMVSEGYSGDHELVRGGYRQIIDALREKGGPGGAPLKNVMLNTVVTRVELEDNGFGVRVYTRPTGSAFPQAPKVLQAHAAICTLPIGVLQHALKENKTDNDHPLVFQPPLPPFKRAAINSLAMGTENRIAMLFPKVFWNPKAHFLRPVAGDYTFANNHALGVTNVLCAWIRPSAVDKLEEMSQEDGMAHVEEVLKQMYPDTYVKPIAFHMTKWQSDPFSRGAYTYVPVGASKKDYDTMAAPVSGNEKQDEQDVGEGTNPSFVPLRPPTRLFFAGEGTIKSDAYTVHGAYMSGRREANRIAKWWTEHAATIQRASSLSAD